MPTKGEILSLQSLGSPARGRTEKAGSGSVVYLPGQDFTGEDDFSYTALNRLGQTASATAHVRAPFYTFGGKFTGLVTNAPADPATRGLLGLMVARDGAFTGTLQLAGTVYKFRGDFDLAVAGLRGPGSVKNR